MSLEQLVPLLISLSLAGLVLAVGLHASQGDLTYVLRQPKLLSKAVLAVIVIPPIASGLLIVLLPLDPIVKAAIMLMAVSPVPPLVPGKELSVGARKEYAYGLYVAMALLTVVSVPVVFAIASRVFGRQDSVAIVDLVRMVVVGVLLPLAIGVLVRRLAPAVAESIWRIIYIVSLVLVFAAFAPILVKMGPAMISMIGDGTILAMAIATGIAIMGGHLLGGPNSRDRATLAMASGVRHPGIAMMIAASTFQDARVTAGVLLFLLVGLVLSIPYAAWIKRQQHGPGSLSESEDGQPDQARHA